MGREIFHKPTCNECVITISTATLAIVRSMNFSDTVCAQNKSFHKFNECGFNVEFLKQKMLRSFGINYD